MMMMMVVVNARWFSFLPYYVFFLYLRVRTS
jgi:hypothetical protein